MSIFDKVEHAVQGNPLQGIESTFMKELAPALGNTDSLGIVKEMSGLTQELNPFSVELMDRIHLLESNLLYPATDRIHSLESNPSWAEPAKATIRFRC